MRHGPAVILLGIATFLTGITHPANPAGPNSLRTHQDRPFSFEQLEGKTVVLNFIFTHCPSVCPIQTQALNRVRQGLPEGLVERVQFVSVSIDPERDTPEVLSQFASRFGVERTNWSFVTGSSAEIEAIKKRYGVQVLPQGAGPLDHRADVRLIDAAGRHLQTYTGNPLDEQRLIREITTVDRMFGRRPSDDAPGQGSSTGRP